MGGAYYNEWERFPAEWLCNLMAAGKITNGRVDQRSIKEVQGHEIEGYERVHLFAGIAGWELALEQAGWPRGLPVWTGSCPCQPFSTAGKGKGVNDERHLWPEMLRLVADCRPPIIFGEQVASKAGRAWLAALRADLEALGYAVGAADLCAAGVGAPHIRQRLWWVAWLADSTMLRRTGGRGAEAVALQGERAERGGEHAEPGCTGFVSRGSEGLRGDGSTSGRLAFTDEGKCGWVSDWQGGVHNGAAAGRQQGDGEPQSGSTSGRLAYRSGAGLLRAEQPQDHRGSVQGGGTGYFEQDCAGESGDAASGRLAYRSADGRLQECADGRGSAGGSGEEGRAAGSGLRGAPDPAGLGHPADPRLQDGARRAGGEPGSVAESERSGVHDAGGDCADSQERVDDSAGARCDGSECGAEGDPRDEAWVRLPGIGCADSPWSNPTWLPCSDGKARPTQPGIFPLVAGVPGRVGQLRAAGNAIVPQVAAVFIRSFMDAAGIE